MFLLHIKSLIAIVALTVFICLSGCGGGGGSAAYVSTTTPTPADTVFNLGAYASLEPGSNFNITFTGTDTSGASYYGKSQSKVVGYEVIDARNVIVSISNFYLERNGAPFVSGETTSYFNNDRTLYKTIYPYGVIGTPINTFPLPLSVKFGNYTAQKIALNNGRIRGSIWNVSDAGNYIARLTKTLTFDSLVVGTEITTFNTSGTALSMEHIYYNFPSTGITTTLHGKIDLQN